MSSPEAFGPYELIERIHVGGMAEVFRARHHSSGQRVALKRILRSVAEDEEFIQMFRDEAAIASQLNHPNIAKIHDVGRVDATYYIALEFVDGRDLLCIYERALKSRSPIPLDFVLHTATEICRGLEYAHGHTDAKGSPLHLVHRDISLPNIIVSFGGDIKIIDFGIAKAAGKLTRTQVGTIRGKFGYMSPEQVRGLPLDRRSDIFSLGVCLWELLTLERLFTGDSDIAIMEKIRAGDILPPSRVRRDLPPELERIVLKALAKDVDERYSSAADLCADLRAFALSRKVAIDRTATAAYMRSAFTEHPALTGAQEEKSFMTEQKSGSDLDVFEGLAKKKGQTEGDETPTPFAAAVAPFGEGGVLGSLKPTLLGIPAVLPSTPSSPFGSAPPPPRASASAPAMPGASPLVPTGLMGLAPGPSSVPPPGALGRSAPPPSVPTGFPSAPSGFPGGSSGFPAPPPPKPIAPTPSASSPQSGGAQAQSLAPLAAPPPVSAPPPRPLAPSPFLAAEPAPTPPTDSQSPAPTPPTATPAFVAQPTLAGLAPSAATAASLATPSSAPAHPQAPAPSPAHPQAPAPPPSHAQAPAPPPSHAQAPAPSPAHAQPSAPSPAGGPAFAAAASSAPSPARLGVSSMPAPAPLHAPLPTPLHAPLNAPLPAPLGSAPPPGAPLPAPHGLVASAPPPRPPMASSPISAPPPRPLPASVPSGAGPRPLPSSTPAPLPHPPAATAAAPAPAAVKNPISSPIPAKPGSEVDMDWDDDDEKTTVYSKDGSGDGDTQVRDIRTPIPGGLPMPPAQTRTIPGPGALPSQPAMPLRSPLPPGPGFGMPSSMPPGPGVRPGMAPTVTGSAPPPLVSAPTVRLAPGSFGPRPGASPQGSLPVPPAIPREMLQPHSEDGAAGASSRNKYILAGAAAAVLGIVGFLAMPKTGKIAVFVSSGDAALDRFTISIDGQQRCTASPCRLELDRGVHALRATADGFMPYERGITVTGGDAPINISLARGSAGTGLRVGGQQAGVFVVVDGKEVGPLPQELKNLEPGTHKVLFKGTDRYASEEKTVKVSANEIVDLGNVRLKVLRGLATFDVKTPGTKVTLVSGNERRQLMDFSQPVEIDTAKNWQVEATKLGYEEYKSALTFEDGAEKTFPIELREKGNVAVMAQATTVSRQIERPQHTETAAPPPPAPRAESGGGNCTLNINSLPASTLLLDGRPLGSTPKAGVSATAGAHTIVFVHPDHGRKTQTVTCKSGETKTVAARLSE